MDVRKLERIAWAPYDAIPDPTREDWQKSYDALKELCSLKPDEACYPNTLGYLCYYGRHTGGKRRYREARRWFEKGSELCSIESTYKLADMLTEGLGGPADPERARDLYTWMYWFCREEFEGGMKDSKFADTALRMGRLFHDGKLAERNDMRALEYLLEARYAICWRKMFDYYGDDTVEQNILRLMEECEKPPEDMLQARYYGLEPGRVPYLFLRRDCRMTVDLEAFDDGVLRLEFRRKRTDGKKPDKVLWPVPPAMQCFMTDFVVLIGVEIGQIWSIRPGEQVVCDRYEYDEEKDLHQFFLGDELQLKLMGGEYALAMDEFWMTLIRDHPEAGSSVVQ